MNPYHRWYHLKIILDQLALSANIHTWTSFWVRIKSCIKFSIRVIIMLLCRCIVYNSSIFWSDAGSVNWSCWCLAIGLPGQSRDADHHRCLSKWKGTLPPCQSIWLSCSIIMLHLLSNTPVMECKYWIASTYQYYWVDTLSATSRYIQEHMISHKAIQNHAISPEYLLCDLAFLTDTTSVHLLSKRFSDIRYKYYFTKGTSLADFAGLLFKNYSFWETTSTFASVQAGPWHLSIINHLRLQDEIGFRFQETVP